MSAGVYCNIFCPLKKRRSYLVTVYELIQMQALTIWSVNRFNLGDLWNYRRNNDIICHVLFWVLKNPSIVLRHLVTWYECIHTYLIRGARIYSIRWPHYIYHKLTVHRAYMSGTKSKDFLIVYKAHIVMQQRTRECGACNVNLTLCGIVHSSLKL